MTAENATIHIVHVVPGLMPGGMELAMAQVISGLTGGRMRHSVVCLKGEPEIADRLPSSAEIHCMHARPNELRLPLRLAHLFRRVRPTVIHARNWGAWPDTVAAARLTWPRLPVILSFHGLGRAGYMPLRRRLASRLLARMAACLVTVSDRSRELMVANWGWPASKVQVIPNGVDTDRFRPGERPRSSDRIVIGTVGNLRPVKNQALLLEACGQLVHAGRDLEVRIAGEGEERSRLSALAESRQLTDRVRLCGRVEDVPQFLQDLDLFVLSSDSEQHPNALNEAMACGLACVATDVGSVGEMLDGGRCGRITPPGDRPAFAAAIDRFLADPATRQEYAARARQRACTCYSLSRMLDGYGALYRRFASPAGGTA
jgi:glycosyltransferase involved in cell wall biosynthesis